jgi:hypothetical protein
MSTSIRIKSKGGCFETRNAFKIKETMDKIMKLKTDSIASNMKLTQLTAFPTAGV